MAQNTKVATNAILKRLLTDALVQRDGKGLGPDSDFNNTLQAGVYIVDSNTLIPTNGPAITTEALRGVLLVAVYNNTVLQVFFCQSLGKIAYRIRWYGNAGGWTSWRYVAVTV